MSRGTSWRVWLAVALAAPLGGAQKTRPKPLELTFGVYTSDKATTMYRMFTPVLEHLQDLAGEELGRSVDIELEIHRTYDRALQAFVQGDVDFVRFGPASYVLAKERNPKVELLAAELKKGKRSFKGMIVVRRDSPIRELKDLPGCSFAFGDENSTIGRYLAQDILLAAKITRCDLGKVAFLGSHDSVFRAVELEDYDAGSLKESTFKKLNKKGRLRVLVSFDNVTKPWIARAGLDPSVTAALRRALLRFMDKTALSSLKITGFTKATDKDYAPTRASMKRAERYAPAAVAPGK